jgi:hypothetical protein
MSRQPKAADSEAPEPDRLDLHAEPTGRGTTATVTARRGGPDGEVVACERLDLARGKERQKFIAALCDRLGEDAERLLDAESVEQQLAEAAADLASPPPPRLSAPADVVELGDGQVSRPERLILPDVSGLTVPRRIVRGGEPVSEWMLYLRWQDGRREAMPLPEVLTVGGERVFIAPRPPDAPPSMPPGWSAASREAWLAGSTSMPPDEACRLLLESFGKYLDLPSESAAGTVAMLTCWSLLSYVFPVFDAVPYLAVGGPAGSGKSRVFELLGQVVLRPLLTSNLSNPALFRSLHAFGGVALLDEAERLRDSRSPEVQELMSSLLAGYRRGGCATRCEAAGDGKFVMRHFTVFGPKALASINEVPPTLATRCLPVQMFRSPPGSRKPRLRVEADAQRWQGLRDALHTLAMEHGSEWLDLPARQDVVPEMSGRNFELWQPLLSIAAWLEDRGARGMLDLLRRHALLLIESSREAATPPDDEALLRALARATGSGVPPTAGELLATVQEGEPSLFRQWSARAVGSHLGRYGLRSRKCNGRHIFDPSPADLLRVQEAYGIDLDLPPPDPTPDDVPYVPQVPRQRARQGT